jgi:hypothetical protein
MTRRGTPKAGASAPAAAPQAQAPVAAPGHVIDENRPLGSLNVDSLSGDVLKRYAKRAGVRQHDIDGLTEDRLRQNVKLTIANHFELLSEA